ncbi:MAG: protein-glutamate O-methyltransferase CheR [Chryseobacterium sp.]|uniref:CheR family methyltransferase n=1 Tax=Pedobacter TaxID=84567 RepID=UPI000299E454|nr:protein-glutamate O-methyltransferase CheR [Pedobacter sp. G11]MDQ1140934.1 chemotaxis protein methyltransferase CheR [Pedobacter agri]RZJ88524.1 MAG: protein-glutamate O-methyltransferase CheR [Chryseobacterium sp.]
MISEAIDNEQVDALLSDVLEVHGYDFLEYSHASIKRRITRLYTLDNFVSFAEFRYAVKNDKQYFKRFLEEITVNVTEMFRDPGFYQSLRNDVLPVLGTYPFIRVWVAGCSTGEEAYSLAILLRELNLLQKSLIYATDINPSVLEKAKKGIFPLNYLKGYSENYVNSGGVKDFSSYYTANYSLAKFDESLSSKMIFSTHNLVSDHSFNEFQLILCRNVLIYFDKELQHKVFQLFDNSLEKLGYLALGSKESLDFWPGAKQFKRIKLEKIWRKL